MITHRSYKVPNSIIGARVALAFVAAGLLVAGSGALAAVGVALTVIAIAMDALDGIVARRMGLASKLGGVLDVTADRIVEHVYWITFAVAQRIPLWIPLVIVTRSFLVDAVRGLALVQGKTAFGDSTMARSALTRFLTGSRAMRALYGVAKLGAFVLIGALIALDGSLRGSGYAALEVAAWVSALTTDALCVVRGVPVIADARAYLATEPRAAASAR